MSDHTNNDSIRLGFLTAIEAPDNGYVGGLLITNRFGRPLEFQCTTPVKPNRTQIILYGPTLVPYIVGELIGRTLVEKVSLTPHLIVTDCPEMLDLRSHVSIPIACLDSETIVIKSAAANRNAETEQYPVHAAGDEPLRYQEKPTPLREEPVSAETPSDGVTMGRQFLKIHPEHVSDGQILRQHAKRIPADANLQEPLNRVREALAETIHNGAVR